jgi:hypothetical protein
VHTLTPLPVPLIHSRFLTILSAEIRLLLKVPRWWWYLVAAGFMVVSAVVPDPSARGMLLGCAWPILLWSSMGIREVQHQTHQLLFSAPHPISRQLPAVWLAGVLLAILTGSGFAQRLLVGGNWRGLFAWLTGSLFIPTSALALGVWSGSAKPFESSIPCCGISAPCTPSPPSTTRPLPRPHPQRITRSSTSPHRGLRRSRSTRPQTPTPRLNLHVLPN